MPWSRDHFICSLEDYLQEKYWNSRCLSDQQHKSQTFHELEQLQQNSKHFFWSAFWIMKDVLGDKNIVNVKLYDLYTFLFCNQTVLQYSWRHMIITSEQKGIIFRINFTGLHFCSIVHECLCSFWAALGCWISK